MSSSPTSTTPPRRNVPQPSRSFTSPSPTTTPLRRSPPQPNRSFTSKRSSTNHERRSFLRILCFGFGLGVAATCSFNLWIKSNNQLRDMNANYDQYLSNSIPLITIKESRTSKVADSTAQLAPKQEESVNEDHSKERTDESVGKIPSALPEKPQEPTRSEPTTTAVRGGVTPIRVVANNGKDDTPKIIEVEKTADNIPKSEGSLNKEQTEVTAQEKVDKIKSVLAEKEQEPSLSEPATGSTPKVAANNGKKEAQKTAEMEPVTENVLSKAGKELNLTSGVSTLIGVAVKHGKDDAQKTSEVEPVPDNVLSKAGKESKTTGVSSSSTGKGIETTKASDAADLPNTEKKDDKRIPEEEKVVSKGGTILKSGNQQAEVSWTEITRGSISATGGLEEIVEFERQDRVVIATKIHGANHVSAIKQAFCLLKFAYNDRVNYDILIFSTMSISDEELEEIRQAVAPANLIFVVDNPGLTVMADALNPEQKAHLLQRCDVNSTDQLDWYLKCKEHKGFERLAYTWQAEFRALHVWTHPVLAPYKYMMWFDSDAFCTRVWERDPIAFAMKHQLAILFANFPAGRSSGDVFEEKMLTAFNKTLCSLGLSKGQLVPNFAKGSKKCKKTVVAQIHGFFHITDLDFYRSEPVMHWARTLIGDSKFSRQFDDQIGVTVPAAILAANRSWDMNSHGLIFDVFHNFFLDGKKSRRLGFGSYVKWNYAHGKKSFPKAYGKCNITNGNR